MVRDLISEVLVGLVFYSSLELRSEKNCVLKRKDRAEN